MACTELAVTKVLFRKLIMSQAELCLPIIPLLLFREEIMLGTPVPTCGTPPPQPHSMDKHQDQLVPGNRGERLLT